MRGGDFCTQRRGGLDGQAITWAVRKRREGMSLQAIANALGCSTDAVLALNLPKPDRAPLSRKPTPLDGLVWTGSRSDKVLEHVATAWGVRVADIKSQDRTRRIAYARFAAMAALRETLGFNDAAIGRAVCRDRSTVISGLDAHKILVETGELEAYRQAYVGPCHVSEPLGRIVAGLQPVTQA